jgi:predicted lipoprotein
MTDFIEEMARNIAVALNGGEFNDGKWYGEGHRTAWRNAVKPYADENEMLRAEVEKLKALLNNIPLMVEKWDTFYVDLDGKIHHSGIGKTIAHDIRSMLHSNGGTK